MVTQFDDHAPFDFEDAREIHEGCVEGEMFGGISETWLHALLSMLPGR